MPTEAAVAFWEDFVLTDTPPEQTGVGETFVRYVRERFPRNVEPIAEATADEEAVMEAVMTAKKRADEAAAEFELQKARMQALIGDRAGLISDTLGRITWKSSKDRETVDWRESSPRSLFRRNQSETHHHQAGKQDVPDFRENIQTTGGRKMSKD